MDLQLGFSGRNKRTISDHAYELLCDAIVEGRIEPGERLKEAEVGESLGVSRTPIREAFTKLQQQHLLEKDISGAYFVAKWGEKILWEIATLRANLEGMCIKLAVKHLTPKDFDMLESIVTQMERAFERDDSKRLIELDVQFHSYIWSRTGHQLLEEALAQLKPQLRYWMFLTRPDRDQRDIVGNHNEFVQVLRKKDPKLAYKVMQEHSFQTIERAFSRLGIELDEEWMQNQLADQFDS